MSPRHVVVILNPAAGRGQAMHRRAELERLLAQTVASLPHPAHWEIRETGAPGDGMRLATEAATDGAEVVAAAGGDGTLSEVTNGLARTGVMLGFLPLGTGNDFVRTLGLNPDDLPRAVHTLFYGTPKSIDLGRCGDRWFLNVAGCGFDAVVAERVNRGFRRLRGTSAYLAAVCQSLLTFRPAALTLTLDGETRAQRAMLCSVANARAYGGGMLIAPDARLDDGLFDICLLGEAGKIEFLRAFPRVFKGTHTTHPKVTMLRARHVRIESDPPMPVFVDGDVIGHTPAEFILVPHVLDVMTP